jgi:tetratricopeptide (TPR) repeat protein
MSRQQAKSRRSEDRPAAKRNPPRKPSRLPWLLLAGLLLATFLAYYPSWHGGLLWDDDRHLTRADLRSPSGLWRIWFDIGATQQYYPVAHSAFWLQSKLWGDDTLGYHLVNIGLHAVSAFLLAFILRRLDLPWGWLAAFLFALHPVHVESVAWISELKNTLSGVLYLASVLVYLRFDQDRRRMDYALALTLFLLALLTKTVTASLPAALLVVLWWRRGGLDRRRDILPLIPWAVLGVTGGWVTAWVERTMVGAHGSEYQATWIERGLIAGRAVWFYLGKLVWPANLTFIYPRWQVSQEVGWQYLYPLCLAALLTGLWLIRGRSRGPLATMLLFCGTLFPALGFVDVYPFRYSFVADHFQYLASIPILVLFTAGVARAARRWRIDSIPAAAGITLVLAVVLVIPTWSQSRQYRDGETLYRTTLQRNPSCWMASNNLGNVLHAQGRTREAIPYYEEALRLKPDYAEAHNNFANALVRLGRGAEAVPHYEEALRLAPDLAGAHYNLGNTLQEMGRLEEALGHYREAIREEPDSAEAQGNLGAILDALGYPEEAMASYRQAIRINPAYANAHNNLGKALQKLGRFEEAVAEHRQALKSQPDLAAAHSALGLALQQLGRFEEAMQQHQEALRLDPKSAESHGNLGNALLAQGRTEDASAEYREAIRLKPDAAAAYFNFGNALQAQGRLEESVLRYREAIQRNPVLAGAHYNLALVLQRLGRYSEAATHYRAVMRLGSSTAELNNNLGICMAAQGRIEEAVPFFREALRLKPDNTEAQANLDRALSFLKRK